MEFFNSYFFHLESLGDVYADSKVFSFFFLIYLGWDLDH